MKSFARMRILAGSAKGRAFEAPEGSATRPTLVRVRKSLFDTLSSRLPEAVVLDLFAGSGSLSLEAASRGAGRVFANDFNRDCARLIDRNAVGTGLSDRITVWQYDYAEALRHAECCGLTFDLVFLDAPYYEGLAEKAIEQIFSGSLLREDGLVLWEHDRHTAAEAQADCGVRWEKTYGDVAVTALGRIL